MDHETASDDQGIPPRLVEQFEHEILHQWEIARTSINMMNAVLKNQSHDMDQFWFGVDAALGALGNISKVFFCSNDARGRTKRRCAHMRGEYGVTETSLLVSRGARNSFEHFDEKLDDWYHKSTRKNFADRNIGGPGMIGGLDPGDFARNYDPEANTVTVFGVALDFQALVSEVDQLVQRVQAKHQGQRRPGAEGAPGTPPAL